jgi:hypothetical protein
LAEIGPSGLIVQFGALSDPDISVANGEAGGLASKKPPNWSSTKNRRLKATYFAVREL